MAEPRPGWRRVKLGEVIERYVQRTDDVQSFARFVGVDDLESEDLRLRQYRIVGVDELPPTFRFVFRAGMILVPTRRPRLRKCAAAHFDGLTGEKILVLRPVNDRGLVAEFAPFLLSSPGVQEWAIQKELGSVTPHFRWSDLAEYEFSLPPPDEQRRVATALNRVWDCEDALRETADAIDSLEASLLLDEFGNFPVGSREGYVSLSAASVIQSGVAKGRPGDPVRTVEVPYLGVANVKDGELDLGNVQLISVEKCRVDDFKVRPGDVLMTEGGDLDKLGRGTVWQGEIDDCVHQNHVFAVRPNPSLLNPWYLAALARSPFGREFFQKCAKRTSNLASINKRELGTLPVPVRTLPEQERFVNAWRSIRARRSHVDARRAELRCLARKLLVMREEP